MLTAITSALSFLLQSKKNRRETKRQLSTQDKKELKKINEMGMFEAMDYLAKKNLTKELLFPDKVLIFRYQ